MNNHKLPIIGTAPTYAVNHPEVSICPIPAMQTNRIRKNGSLETYHCLHPSLNEWTGKHHLKQWSNKSEWELYYQKYIRLSQMKPIEGQTFMFIFYHFSDEQRRDYDNYAPKFLMDALVKEGILQDDSQKILKCAPFVKFMVSVQSPHMLVGFTQNKEVFLRLIDENTSE